MFSKKRIMTKLIDKESAVLAFNNRGSGTVSKVMKGDTTIRGGSAHEVFTDCVDDIEGAVRCARAQRPKEIFLVGHSTGCQKAVYWARKRGTRVRGIVLMAPVSDLSAARKLIGRRKIARALAYARTLLRKGERHTLLPEKVWGWDVLADAQRFVSLYGGQSAEEIFTYWDQKRQPRLLRSVRLPMLVLLAEKDEYADRHPVEMAAWFATHIGPKSRVGIVRGATHGFRGKENEVARLIRRFCASEN